MASFAAEIQIGLKKAPAKAPVSLPNKFAVRPAPSAGAEKNRLQEMRRPYWEKRSPSGTLPIEVLRDFTSLMLASHHHLETALWYCFVYRLIYFYCSLLFKQRKPAVIVVVIVLDSFTLRFI